MIDILNRYNLTLIGFEVNTAEITEKYQINFKSLNSMIGLETKHLPDGWSVWGKRVSTGLYTIETPWGDYAELLKEQTDKGFIDLYAREPYRLAKLKKQKEDASKAN